VKHPTPSRRKVFLQPGIGRRAEKAVYGRIGPPTTNPRSTESKVFFFEKKEAKKFYP
jgi:hypothetical protein